MGNIIIKVKEEDKPARRNSFYDHPNIMLRHKVTYLDSKGKAKLPNNSEELSVKEESEDGEGSFCSNEINEISVEPSEPFTYSPFKDLSLLLNSKKEN